MQTKNNEGTCHKLNSMTRRKLKLIIKYMMMETTTIYIMIVMELVKPTTILHKVNKNTLISAIITTVTPTTNQADLQAIS